MTTAHELGRRCAPWPCELRGGVAHRLAGADPAAQRLALRIARVLQPAAEVAGAWVSTEALIRLAKDPDTALRPAVAVVAGPLPYDGVVDEGVLVVVERDVERVATWRAARTAPVWVPQARGVLVAGPASTSIVEPHRELTLPGHPRAAVVAGDLIRVVALSP